MNFIREWLQRPAHKMFKRKAVNLINSKLILNENISRYILLGSKGIDVPKISKNLETLSSRKTFETLDPVYDTDIHSFLKNEKENAILSIIQDVNKSVSEIQQFPSKKLIKISHF